MLPLSCSLVPQWQLSKLIVRRVGGFQAGRTQGGAKTRLVWPCKDGYVLYLILGGPTGVKTNRAMTEWMDSEEMAPEYFKQVDWDTFDMADQTPELEEQLEEPIAKFFMSHTKAELYEGAQQRHMMLVPMSSPGDILEDIQLRSRQFWVKVEHPELDDTITYPGAPVRASETPCQIRRPAPLIGEHNREVYEEELGLSQEQLAGLKQTNVI